METREESGVPDTTVGLMDVLELLRKLVQDGEPVLKAAGIRAQVISAEEHIDMEADPTSLTKIFYNLLENSVKHMGRPGNIYITATCMDDKVRLTFRDDGFGLESALCERVFDKGWRGSDQNAGNGMGLYMVRNTVEACGGTVTASGDLGKGMSVQIALPVRRAVVRRPEEKMTAQP